MRCPAAPPGSSSMLRPNLRLLLLSAVALAAMLPLGTAEVIAQPSQAAVPVCPGPAAPSDARCHAHVQTHGRAGTFVSSSPTGLAPAQIKSAYSFPISLTAGAGTT